MSTLPGQIDASHLLQGTTVVVFFFICKRLFGCTCFAHVKRQSSINPDSSRPLAALLGRRPRRQTTWQTVHTVFDVERSSFFLLSLVARTSFMRHRQFIEAALVLHMSYINQHATFSGSSKCAAETCIVAGATARHASQPTGTNWFSSFPTFQ